jgi:predicted transcriptional regulator
VQIKLTPENEAAIKRFADAEKRSPTFIANQLLSSAIMTTQPPAKKAK